jgi:hypothetical protein
MLLARKPRPRQSGVGIPLWCLLLVDGSSSRGQHARLRTRDKAAAVVIICGCWRRAAVRSGTREEWHVLKFFRFVTRTSNAGGRAELDGARSTVNVE